MEGLVAIYGLYDPRDGALRYIGKAADPTDRLRRHRSDKNSHTHGHPLTEWIARVWQTGSMIDLRILEWVPATNWRSAERRHIREAQAGGEPLLNINPGGNGSQRDANISPELRRKRGENLRRWYATATREQIQARVETRRLLMLARGLAANGKPLRAPRPPGTGPWSKEDWTRHLARMTKLAATVNSSPAMAGSYAQRGLAMRGKKRKPTRTCKKGHARTPANTYIAPNGSRHCRDCDQLRNNSERAGN